MTSNLNSDSSEPEKTPAEKSGKTNSRSVPAVSYESISGGSDEVQIEYAGQIYRLRVTRNGKLILNK